MICSWIPFIVSLCSAAYAPVLTLSPVLIMGMCSLQCKVHIPLRSYSSEGFRAQSSKSDFIYCNGNTELCRVYCLV